MRRPTLWGPSTLAVRYCCTTISESARLAVGVDLEVGDPIVSRKHREQEMDNNARYLSL